MSKLTITTEVDADANTNPGTLNVKDHGHAIEVPKEPDTTKLEWILTPAGPANQFNAIDLSDPATSGFSWVDPSSAPAGFKTPTRSPNGDKIIMEDDNTNQQSAGGPYTYMLRATVGGVPCATTASVSSWETYTNPKIENEPD